MMFELVNVLFYSSTPLVNCYSVNRYKDRCYIILIPISFSLMSCPIFLLLLLLDLFTLDVLLLEVRQEAVPVFVSHFRVFGKFLLDHEFLDVVDRVDVAHAVNNDAHHSLQVFVVTHGGDRVALDQDVAVRQ